MAIGNDFNYFIPEMDRLLDAADDIGIHFASYQETVNDYGKDGIFVVQISMVKRGETSVTFSVTKTNPKTRGTAQPTSGRKPLLDFSRGRQPRN